MRHAIPIAAPADMPAVLAPTRTFIAVECVWVTAPILGAVSPLATAYLNGWPMNYFVWSSLAVMLIACAARIMAWACWRQTLAAAQAAADASFQAGREAESIRLDAELRRLDAEQKATERYL